ncbi:MAG TPA: hypothetical protein VIJ34_03590 [Acidimicrobiales bacterium]
MAWLASAPRADGPPHAWGRLSHGDRVGVTLLLSAAVILYVPLSIAGHPLVPGDDLTQNYPLRVLTGSLISDGHFPTWDPFIWSGTPLLAGWNAGSLYPGTWLFALLPGVAAWTLNLVLLSATAGLGVYVLLRILRCGPLGATLGALCFTYTGFISGQLVHIGLVQGAAYLAWMLVAVELLARASTIRAAMLPVLLLAASAALCALAGEPRAISSAVIVVWIYLALRLLGLGWRRGFRLAAVTATGVVLGMGIGAAQWLPGLAFVARSQRTLDAYQSFGAGSFRWSALAQSLLVPFLLGGNTNLGLPIYVGGYNLAEVTVGVGLLPLVAACAYLPRLGASGLVSLGRLGGGRDRVRARVANDPSRPSRRALAVWYVMGLVGMLLTLGTTTPLGRILSQIPLFGGQRLQNRNAVIFDLALAVFLGFFVDDLVGLRRDADHRAEQSLPLLETLPRRLLAALPVVGCLGFVAVAYLDPIGLQLRLGVTNPAEDLFKRLTPYLGVTVALAFAIGCFAFAAHRLTHASRVVLVVVLAGADLGVYVANASYATAPSAVLAGSTTVSRHLAQLSEGGRFALYDPLDIGATQGQSSSELGKPDVNVLRAIPSVQGYGSILSGLYQDDTNTHSLGDLNPAVLRNGLATELDLRVFLTLPVYLEEGLPPNSSIPIAGVVRRAASGSRSAVATPAPAPLASGPWVVDPSSRKEWLLPSVSVVRRVTVVVNDTSGPTPRVLDVALERPGQAAHFTAVPVAEGKAVFVSPSPQSAEVVVIGDPGSGAVTVGAVVVVTKSPDNRLLLDGSLQGSLASPQWVYDGHLGPYTAFLNHDVDGTSWLQSASSRTLTGAQAGLGSVVTTSESTSGTEKMSVVASRPSLLVRSVAYEPGSTAKLASKSGSARRLAVRRLGLIQAVEIPAGNYQVTWSYAPRSVVLGVLLSLGSVVVTMLVVAVFVADRRRRRRTGLSATLPLGP